MKRLATIVLALTLAAQAAGAQAPSFTDARGQAVRLPAKAVRIVSLSPAITEILFAAGAGSAVVGVTTYCNYPVAQTAGIAKVGGFSANTISAEAIAALRPDLVLGELSAHGRLATQLERMGLRFAALELSDFASVYTALEILGAAGGDEKTAGAVVASMRARIEAIRIKTATVPASARPLVFWETWDEPLMSAGPGTFTGQVIEAAGGRNCFADSGVDWPVVSFEAVLARDPDYIMAAESHGAALTLERLARRVGWSSLKAVRAGRVVLLDGDIVSRAGPRLVDAIELMAGVLYPELFK